MHKCSHWLAVQAFCTISFDPFDKTAGNYINTAQHYSSFSTHQTLQFTKFFAFYTYELFKKQQTDTAYVVNAE